MKSRFAVGPLVLAGVASSMLPASAAPTAQEILNKFRATMNSAKTYQATVVTSISGGPMTMNSSTKLKTAGNKAWAQVGTTTSGGAQQNPFAAMMRDVVMVDDGKNTYVYIPAMKQYQKGPAGLAKNVNMVQQISQRMDQNVNLTMAGTESVGGRPAYIVEAKPKKAQPGSSGNIRLYFDQATYHLVEAKITQSRPASGKMPAQQQTIVTLVKDQKINQPIPDSVFKFTPPPGAKEAQAGGMGMGMGMPGARGRK